MSEVEEKLPALAEDPAQEARHGEDDMTMRNGLDARFKHSPHTGSRVRRLGGRSPFAATLRPLAGALGESFRRVAAARV